MSETSDRGAGNRLGVLEAVRGASFPASRDDLVAEARRNEADEATRYAVEHLPDRTFDSPEAVGAAIGGGLPSPAGQGSAPHAGEPQAAAADPAPLGDATKGIGTIPGSES